MSFEISLSFIDFEAVIATAKGDENSSRTIQAAWVKPFETALHLVEKSSTKIKPTKARVNPVESREGSSYFRAYGLCKGPTCKVAYTFNVKSQPTDADKLVVVSVTKGGEHVHDETIKQQLRGSEARNALATRALIEVTGKALAMVSW
jgi:hypothetical protein